MLCQIYGVPSKLVCKSLTKHTFHLVYHLPPSGPQQKVESKLIVIALMVTQHEVGAIYNFQGCCFFYKTSQMSLWIFFCQPHVHQGYNNRWSFMLNWLFSLVDQTEKPVKMEICWNLDFFLQFYRFYKLSFIDYAQSLVSSICLLHMEDRQIHFF